MSNLLSFEAFNALTWTFTAASIVITSLRLYSRAFVAKAVGFDDGLMVFSQCIIVTLAAVMTWHSIYFSRVYSLAVTEDLPLGDDAQKARDDLNMNYRSGFCADAIYMFALPAIKCSILAFYGRVTPRKKHYILLYVIAFVMVAQAIINVLFAIFSFEPASTWYNYAYTENIRIRFSTYDLQIINSSFQVFFDVVLLGLPLPFIFKTRLSKHDRNRVIFVYLLCCISLIATSIRFYYVTEFSIYDSQISTIENRQRHMYWAQIEIVTAAICANLPAMPNFLRHFWRTAKSVISPSSLDRSNQSSTDYSNISCAEHKDSSRGFSRRSRSFVNKQFSTLRRNTLTGMSSNSPNPPTLSTSLPDLPEEKVDVFVDVEAVSMELVPRQKGTAHRTEVVSSAIAGNGNDGGGKNSHFSLPLPTRAHRPQDTSRTAAGGRNLDMTGEPEQRIIRTDQVDVERSLA